MSENSKSSNPLSGPAICPDCGAVNSAGAGRCWLCQRALGSGNAPATKSDGSTAKGVPPQAMPAGVGRGPGTFSLATLMLLVTLAAVLCGLTAVAPGLGIPLAVLVTPALIRTFAATNVRRAQGLEPTAEAKIGMFLASIGLMVLIMIAGFAVFFVGCCATFSMASANSGNFSNSRIVAATVLTFVAVVGVMIWLFIKYWPRRSKTGIPQQPPRT